VRIFEGFESLWAEIRATNGRRGSGLEVPFDPEEFRAESSKLNLFLLPFPSRSKFPETSIN